MILLFKTVSLMTLMFALTSCQFKAILTGALGSLIKADQLALPFYTSGSKVVDVIDDQNQIQRVDYECFLNNVIE